MDGGGSVLTLAKPASCRIKLAVEPRNPHEGFLQAGLNSAASSPTPMIFGSSLLSERDLFTDCKPFLSLLTETPESPNFAQAAPHVDSSPWNKAASDMATYSRAEDMAEVKLEGAGEDYCDSQFVSSARYKAMVPSRLPITASSPHLTISPGISPTSLLESPILFNSQQMDASPTTGSFLMPLEAWRDGLPCSPNAKENGARTPERNDSFAFKPLPLAEGYGSPPHISMGGTFEMDAQGNSQYSDGFQMQSEESGYGASQASDLQASGVSFAGLEADQGQYLDAAAAVHHARPAPITSYQATAPAAVASGVTSSGRLVLDGYNWKKYGQKTLKNSENPRNYYKCTYPNCPAKRRVECSAVGDVIICKGAHNHAKPEGNRRRARSVQGYGAAGAAHPDPARDSREAGRKVAHASTVEGMPYTAAGHGGLIPATPELSFTSPSNEDEEIGDHASMLGYESEDQSHPKRRRLDGEEDDRLQESLRTAREPRVIVQTVSENDIIDDGYRWRKYGQKVVKGHYYPRNYYKCTNTGCRVKKLVERSSSDVRSVMTTYEGKHNHGVPRPARGSVPDQNEDMDMFREDDDLQLDSQDGGCGSDSNSQIY